jgi:predicted transcriptional regulator of viral defense system
MWTPMDFLDLGGRAGIDKALQRLSQSHDIRRIDRGLYDVPTVNRLTGKATMPDYAAVIDAVARRDQARILVDGMTAANQLGLTDALPAHVFVHSDARIRPIKLGNFTITFKLTAPSRLYWAGRPAMRIIQALHWLRDLLPTDQTRPEY